jgi:hypothetical protein
MASAGKVRVTVTVQSSGKSSVFLVQTLDDLLRQCSSKFRIKARRIFLAATGEEILTNLSNVTNDTKLIVTCGDLYVSSKSASIGTGSSVVEPSLAISVRIIANRTLIEQTAVDQLNNVARIYSHVKHVWGMYVGILSV